MLKKLVFVISLIFFFGAVSIAQEKPKQEKMKEAEKTEKEEMHIKQEVIDYKETVSEGPWNKLCPVMGNKVDPEVPTVEYEGKAYGFCCPGCDDKFRNNPEKYSKNLSEDGTKFVGKKSRH
jgi:YHS domain-containing protein